jgi:hypothetical protein
MSTIVTRAGKGSPLTNNEVDANFNNLNSDKLEAVDQSVTTAVASGGGALSYSSGSVTFTYTPPDLSIFSPINNPTFTGLVTAPDLTVTGNLTIPDDGLFAATNTLGSIWVADGTNFNAVPMGGDATIASDGTVTVSVAAGDSNSLIQTAKVNEAGGIVQGDVVYISGATGGAAQVSIADNTDFDKAGVIAMARESGSNGQSIEVILEGEVTGLDTSAFAEGEVVYLGIAGGIINVHPSGIDAVVRVGNVVKVNPATGSVFFHVDSLTVAVSNNGIVRDQLVNLSSGTGASAAYTLVNDLGHRSSVSMVGSGFTAIAGIAESMVIYNEGYNKTVIAVDGNFGFEWWTDVADNHNLTSTVKMALSAAGNLTIAGTVDGRDVALDGTNQDSHIADGTIHFTQAAISITESQISDLQAYLTSETSHADVLVDADIGVNVQAYSATNALTGDITYGQLNANGDVGTSAGQLAIGNHNHSGVYEPADGTILKDADIGVNVQAYSATNALTGDITYGQLDTNGDVGTSAGQLAIGNHNHSGVYEPVDATILKEADVDDTPVNGVTTAPISSNWAFDHDVANDHIDWTVSQGATDIHPDNYVAGSESSVDVTINQSSHGLAVLDCVRYNGTNWVKAQADSADTTALGVVTSVADINNFTYAITGRYTITHGLTTDEWYYLDSAVAGGLTVTAPTIEQPIVYVDDSTHLSIYAYRPSNVAGTAASSTTKQFEASETVAAGDLCVLNSAGRMQKADASALATASSLLAIANEAISAVTTGEFLLYGSKTGYTGMTIASVRYISATAGEQTETAPSTSGDMVRVVGYALSATELWFDPDKTWVEIT